MNTRIAKKWVKRKDRPPWWGELPGDKVMYRRAEAVLERRYGLFNPTMALVDLLRTVEGNREAERDILRRRWPKLRARIWNRVKNSDEWKLGTRTREGYKQEAEERYEYEKTKEYTETPESVESRLEYYSDRWCLWRFYIADAHITDRMRAEKDH